MFKRLLVHLAVIWVMSAPAFAQGPPMTGLVGLPDQNVLLTGTMAHPFLVNNTKQKIIGHVIFWVPGQAQVTLSYRGKARGDQDMLPPGQAIEVHPDSALPDRLPQAAYLGAIVFENGEVVGPSAQKLVDMIQPRIEAERDIHSKLVHGNSSTVWAEIEALANMDLSTGKGIPPGVTFESADYAATIKSMAHELVLIRDAPGGGPDQAMKTAHTSENYPNLRVKK